LMHTSPIFRFGFVHKLTQSFPSLVTEGKHFFPLIGWEVPGFCQ
jgi:hypothetical protein